MVSSILPKKEWKNYYPELSFENNQNSGFSLVFW